MKDKIMWRCARCNQPIDDDGNHWCLPEKIDYIVELLNTKEEKVKFTEKELEHIKNCIKYRWTTLHPEKPRTKLKAEILRKIDDLILS